MYRISHRRDLNRRRVITGAFTGAILLLSASPAIPPALAASCQFDSSTRAVSVSLGPNETGALSVRDGAIYFNSEPCGSARVTNTDSVAISGSTGSEEITIDLGSGQFAPGSETETDAPEIEFTVDLVNDFKGDVLVLAGTDAPDIFEFGSAGGNLNGDGDADVLFKGVAVIRAVTRGGDDTVEGASGRLGGTALARLEAYGGPGNDTISGTAMEDSLLGEEGADTLSSGPDIHRMQGSDAPAHRPFWHNFLTGGPGPDRIHGGPSPDHFDMETSIEADGKGDTVSGGGGFDVLSYSRTGGLNITMDGQSNDGEQGENDNIGADIERIYGTPANDLIDASGAPPGNADYFYQFFGFEGNDTLVGSDGTDTLYGSGLESNNVPYSPGTADDDLLDGRGGHDFLEGANGSDIELGGEGDDGFGHSGIGVARDGKRDTVDGGPGKDTAVYQRGSLNMYIALNNIPDDGEYFEEDNIKDSVENIHTGDGHDTIIAFGNIDNVLTGGEWGEDKIEGAGGNDHISGSRSNDILLAGEGNDVIVSGQGGEDQVSGGPGNDRIDDTPDYSYLAPWERLVPGAGRLWGDEGDDCIKARDGAADTVDGGRGRDLAVLDPDDRHKSVRPVNDCFTEN